MSTELCKELAFGATFGLCAGFAAKKFGSALVGGVCAGSFIMLRGLIFEGRHLATWSPLAIDDASFANHMLRKTRREAIKTQKRGEYFVRENLYVLGGFAGGIAAAAASVSSS